jgi:predicted HicB family RNase H-like nuclease
MCFKGFTIERIELDEKNETLCGTATNSSGDLVTFVADNYKDFIKEFKISVQVYFEKD